MRPMKLPENKDEQKEIDKDLQNAIDELSNQENIEQNKQNKSNAQKNQKAAAKNIEEREDHQKIPQPDLHLEK